MLFRSWAAKSDGNVPEKEFPDKSMYSVFLGNFGTIPINLLLDSTIFCVLINSKVAGSVPVISLSDKSMKFVLENATQNQAGIAVMLAFDICRS